MGRPIPAALTCCCHSPAPPQAGAGQLAGICPTPVQAFAAEAPLAWLLPSGVGESSGARSLFSAASLAPSLSPARGGLAGVLGLGQEDLCSGPGPPSAWSWAHLTHLL